MNPILYIFFVVGLLVGFVPTYSWYSWQNDIREREILELQLSQEKKNVEVVTKYQDLLNNVTTWYNANPVRVRVQGTKECPGGIATDASSVILTVGGVKGSNSKTIDP